MTDTFRALCAELVDIATAHCHPDDDAVGYCAAVLSRARAALAQPEPVALTYEELDELAIYWWGSEFDERSVSDVIESGSMAAYAHAVLAHLGRPAIEPVPGVEGKP